MVIFEAIDAAHGDSILVRYQGNSGFQRIILVDAGPKSANNEDGEKYVPYEDRVIPAPAGDQGRARRKAEE